MTIIDIIIKPSRKNMNLLIGISFKFYGELLMGDCVLN